MNLQDQLNQILQDLSAASAETSLIGGSILLLVVGLIGKKPVIHKIFFFVALATALYFNLGLKESGYFISNSLTITTQIVVFTSLFLLVAAVALIFPRKEHTLEFYFLLLSLIIGASFMIKANSLLLIYLSIELTSFVSYLLTSFSFKKNGHESAIKYLLFGAMSSAIMLVGLGLMYGSTGIFYLADWNVDVFESTLSQVGLMLTIGGILFKISILPFHIWVPATYQEAPTDAVAIMSIVPKLAGIVLLKRVLVEADLVNTHWIIQTVLILGLVTVLVGTAGALRQSNTRRMISFGAIAHSGFLLPFALLVGETSDEAFWWYAVVYAIMNLSAFYLLDSYEQLGVKRNEEYRKTTSEVIGGIAFSVILISVVGIPPLAGFTAKFFLFSSLWEEYELSQSSTYLIYFLGVVFATVISLFFYLRIPYYTFVSGGTKQATASIKFLLSTKIVATIFAFTLLLLFFVPKLIVTMHHLLNNIHE